MAASETQRIILENFESCLKNGQQFNSKVKEGQPGSSCSFDDRAALVELLF